MCAFPIAVLSAAEFEAGRGAISGLSAHASYDEWLDRRYGRFMGLSLGGEDAKLVTIRLSDFLDWCGDNEICPTEAALDSFASDASSLPLAADGVKEAQAGVESSAPELLSRRVRSVDGRSFGAKPRIPKSATRSAGVDL
jgi:hypothetical protein